MPILKMSNALIGSACCAVSADSGVSVVLFIVQTSLARKTHNKEDLHASSHVRKRFHCYRIPMHSVLRGSGAVWMCCTDRRDKAFVSYGFVQGDAEQRARVHVPMHRATDAALMVRSPRALLPPIAFGARFPSTGIFLPSCSVEPLRQIHPSVAARQLPSPGERLRAARLHLFLPPLNTPSAPCDERSGVGVGRSVLYLSHRRGNLCRTLSAPSAPGSCDGKDRTHLESPTDCLACPPCHLVARLRPVTPPFRLHPVPYPSPVRTS